MSLVNFVDSMDTIALTINQNSEQHHRFGCDAELIVETIVGRLKEIDSVFQDYLTQLRQSASFVNQIEFDLPLSFEVFLPLRLPFALTAVFNESQRSVQLSKRKTSHPFFFANLVNAKCMNILLQRDLELAISQIKGVKGFWNTKYDITYSALSYNRAPFAHRVVAQERDVAARVIHFDFILALEFDGAETPLPPYYQAPIRCNWLAYGLVSVKGECDSSSWGILVPKWRDAEKGVLLRCQNMLLLLYRMLYVQRCHCLAVPFLVKLCFFMTTVDRGESYKNMSVAQLMITTLGHQVFRNFCKLIVASTVGDPSSNITNSMSLRRQQVRGKGIFAIMAKGLKLNVISTAFIAKLFDINYEELLKQQEQKEGEEKEVEQPPEQDLIKESASRKRPLSI